MVTMRAVGAWKGSCDKSELELEDAERGEDGGDVVDDEVSDDDLSCHDGYFDDGLDSE